MRLCFILLPVLFLISCWGSGSEVIVTASDTVDSSESGIVIDQYSRDITAIPDDAIADAKRNLHIVYTHTSHGSQLITGMNCLAAFPDFKDSYSWNETGSGGALHLEDIDTTDLSQGDREDENGDTPWVISTRAFLNEKDNGDINVVIWSWCSINGHNARRYVDNMEKLISEYPDVTFVFMTGHAEGQSELKRVDDQSNGNVHYNNELIREHCSENDRILYDFAAIESYDPDGTYYWDMDMEDNLNYSGGNWAEQWISANPNHLMTKLTTGNGIDGYDGCTGTAHSSDPSQANLNGILKGMAAWHLWARLAGWDGD